MATASEPVQRLLDRLPDHKPDGKGWKARCPAHDDRKASLHIDVGGDGTALVKCFAGCPTKAVVEALELGMKDLFPSLAPAAPVRTKKREIVRTYDYHDADGSLVFQVVRFEPKDFRQRRLDSSGDWVWNLQGVKTVLFRLPELLKAAADQVVWIVEGEKDAERLAGLGLVATTSPMGADKWRSHYSESLRGRRCVLIPDNDEPGKKHMQTVAASLHDVAASVMVLELPGLPAKGDVSDFVDRRIEDGKADAEIVDELTALMNSVTAAPEPTAMPPLEDFRFAPIDSTAFFSADYKPSWLVRKILVAGQPAVFGGGKKSLKTTLCVDLVISLATGTPFLGEFPVDTPVRTAILSGESGEFTLSETAKRVCTAKGIGPPANCFWQFNLPNFGNVLHLAELSAGLKRLGIGAACIDPWYLCALAGMDASQATNLYAMGPLLRYAAQSCLRVGCTPILVHHFKQGVSREKFDPPQLEDLAFSGIQEFARQWCLLGRREEYEPGSGDHRLWMAVGGSTGHSGLWGLDIQEGQLNDDFTGRKWQVAISTLNQVRAGAEQKQESERRTKQRKQDDSDEAAVMGFIDANDPARQGFGRERIRSSGLIPKGRADAALARLLAAGTILPSTTTVTIGSGATRQVPAVRRPSAQI